MTHIKLDGQIGVDLANRLGLQLPRRAGHDLAGPCISCKSSDAFRLHQQTGVGYCYSCGGQWSPFQVAEVVLGDRERAKAVMVEIGVFKANGDHPAPALDPVEAIARQKGITVQALRAFGARAISTTAIDLPAYGPDGKTCTTFSMLVKGGKGLFAKGKPAGLILSSCRRQGSAAATRRDLAHRRRPKGCGRASWPGSARLRTQYLPSRDEVCSAFRRHRDAVRSGRSEVHARTVRAGRVRRRDTRPHEGQTPEGGLTMEMLHLTMREVKERYGGKLPSNAVFRPDDDELAATAAAKAAEAARREAVQPKRRTRSERFAALNAFVDMGMAELTGAEVKVWLVLFRDTKREGTARAGQADIARRAGLSVRSVKTALKALREKDLVRMKRRGCLNAGPSTYVVYGTGELSCSRRSGLHLIIVLKGEEK